jgi:hypothetical protein
MFNIGSSRWVICYNYKQTTLKNIDFEHYDSKVSLILAEMIRSPVIQYYGLGIWNRLIISEPESANMRTSG